MNIAVEEKKGRRGGGGPYGDSAMGGRGWASFVKETQKGSGRRGRRQSRVNANKTEREKEEQGFVVRNLWWERLGHWTEWVFVC